MVSGHPDWQTWAGRSAGGEAVTTYSFTGEIASGASGTIDLPIVATGYQNIYQSITISCDDDSAIHNLTLQRISDAWAFFIVNFITGGIYDFPGQAISAGQTVRITITNNAAVAKTFEGTANYVSRKI